MSDANRTARGRRSSLPIVAGLAASAAPLLILVVPAVLRLPIVEPLLHESEFFPGFSRALLVGIPLVGLVAVNLAIFAANRSLPSALVASLVITSALALLLVLGAVGLVNELNDMFVGAD